MPKSSLRFEILKLLKESPTHGYDLFIILHDEDLVKNASDLYKILRKLKEEEIIKEESEESSSGPEKKILYLTKKGLIEYYERIIDSARDFFDILMEINVKHNGFVENILKNNKIQFPDLENKRIYFNFQNFNPRMQVNVLKKTILPLDKKITIFINEPSVNLRLFRCFERTKINIKFINQNFSLKPNSIDIILSDLFFFNINKQDLKNELESLFKLLVSGGIFILILPGKSMRGPPQMFNLILNEVFRDIPKEILPRLSEIFPEFAMHSHIECKGTTLPKPQLPNPKMIIESEEYIVNILKDSFEKIEKIQNLDAPVIIIAYNYILHDF